MNPTPKAKAIDDLITRVTGVDRKEVITENKCATCKTPNLQFRNQISQKEYTISGMCQNCQDDIFGKD